MKRAIVIALIASTLLAAETAVRKFIPLPEPVNSPENDFAPSFTLDGNTMVFNSKRGNTLQDIYICHRTDGRWGVPRPIDAINSPFNDETPFITADGKVILFASDRDGSIEAPRDAQGRVRVSYDLYWAVLRRRLDAPDAPAGLCEHRHARARAQPRARQALALLHRLALRQPGGLAHHAGGDRGEHLHQH